MDRREFLINAMVASVLFGIEKQALAARGLCDTGLGQTLNRRVLVNVMLDGGPDFRHAFAPAYSSNTDSFGYHYWSNRWRAHAIADSQGAWQTRWNDDFVHHPLPGGGQFGILGNMGWLNQMYADGKVALICNAVGSLSRDHAYSTLVMNQGNLDSGPNDTGRSGWGGRLASLAGGNVLALTRAPRPFCYGLHTSGNINLFDKSNMIATRNTRRFGLYQYDYDLYNLNPAEGQFDQDHIRYDTRGRLARSLRSYYEGRRAELGESSVFHRFMESERKIREFGQKIRDVLDDCPLPQPLADMAGNGTWLDYRNFGEQIRNLYDCLLVNQDLDLRVASLEHGGWDTHDGQRQPIEENLVDLFGTGMALDTLWQHMDPTDRNNTVFLFSGEFGRQLRDNGGLGTDHGRGNIMIMIGDTVNGGVYGNMFPQSEVDKLNDPRQYSPDIDGLTEFDHVYGTICDWVLPGSSAGVFPNQAARSIETPGMFDGLFS